MAIEPKAPVTSVLAVSPPGGAADASKVLLALSMARIAAVNAGAVLGEIVSATDGASVEAVQTSTAPADHHTRAEASLADTRRLAEPTVAERMVAAVRTAAAQAASRQSGLAPMMADLDVALQRSDLPEPVRQAARALLGKAVPIQNPVTAGTLRDAVKGSGVFLEARLARAVQAPHGQASHPSGPADIAGRDMKAALVVFKAVVGAWLAETPAAAQPGGEGGSATLKTAPPSQAPYTAASAGGLQGSHASEASNAHSASFVQAPAIEPAATGEPSIAPHDTGALLESPSTVPGAPASKPAAVEGGLEEETPPSEFAAESDTPPVQQQAQPRPPPVAAARPLLMVGLIEEDMIEAPPTDAPPSEDDARGSVSRERAAYAASGPAPPRPPPPYAGGPTAAQAAKPSDLPPNLAPAELARRLLKDADGALARQELLQIASLPEGRGDAGAPVETRSQRWVFDLPFQTPQGVAVAQFEVSRDGGGGGGADGGPTIEKTWRARFSIDVEPLGPVHVHVALTGACARVGLWAERPETMLRLSAGEASLGAALREAELIPEVAVHPGSPVTPPVELGHFVDRAS